ncbi:MAG: hypothetical protein ACLGSD_05730 [Acidobacteriota bacterium]
MHKRRVAMVLGAVLSAGLFVAQAQQAQPANPDPQAQPAPDPAPSPAQAAPAPRPHPRMHPKRQMKHLTRMLNLSPSQQEQIRPIVGEHDKQLRQLWDDTSLAPQDRRARMRDINQDYRGKMESVLNDQQKQQFEQMLERQRAHRRGGQAPAPPAEAPQTQN